MDMKLYNSELKIMNILWDKGDTTAKELVKILKQETDWSKSTTYTIISRCITKGLIANIDSSFTCHALIEKDDVRKYETKELIQTMYDGSADKLIASMIDGKYLHDDEVAKLKKYIDGIKTDNK